MNHPADGEAWREFDLEYPKFAEDGITIRLGLATDGFNLFSEKTRSTACGLFLLCHTTFHLGHVCKSQTS
jgi:hypothetical protein